MKSESKMTEVQIEMAEIKTDIKYTKEKIDSLEHKIDEFIKSADGKYASKLSEQIVYSLVGLILVAVVTALVALVL
jgi:hypothetical protein